MCATRVSLANRKMEVGVASVQVLAVVTIGAALLLYLLQFRRSRVDISNKAILVTSCDTELGLGCARRLDKLGFRVFAGFSEPNHSSALQLQTDSSQRLRIVEFDANNCEKLDAAVEYIHRHLPADEDGLWAVVNTSSKCFSGLLEKLTWDQCERQVEVNLVAAIRITKAFLPALKRRKGRLVTVTSLGGQLCYPGFAVYAGCKAAVEGFYDSLRYEMQDCGIEFVTISPSIQYHFGSAACEQPEDVVHKFGHQAKLCVLDKKTIYSLLANLEEAVLASKPLPQYTVPPIHNGIWALLSSSLPLAIKKQKLSRDFRTSFLGETTV